MPQDPQPAPQAPQQPQVPPGGKFVVSTPEAEEQVFTPPPTRFEEAVGGVTRATYGNAIDLLKAIVHPDNPLGVAGDVAMQFKKMLDAGAQSAESGEGRAGQTLSMMENAPLVGGMVKKAEEAGPGRFKMEPGTVGAIAEGATTAAIPFAMEKGLSGMAKLRAKISGPLEVDAATQRISEAINPSPKSARGYSATLNQYMHEVVDHAWKQGIDLTDKAHARENLATALQGSADTARTAYYDTYIKPNEQVLVPTQNIPGYAGGTQTYNTASIGQLDARLSEINATLRPAYERGGATARAAISAESKALLKAEAEAIRNRINTTIGSKMGIDPAKIAQARQKFGALGDAADKTRLSIDRDRFAKNQQKSGVVTDKSTLTRKVASTVAEKVFNPDRKVAKTFGRLAEEDPVEYERRRPPQADPAAGRKALELTVKNLEAQAEVTKNPQKVKAARAAREKLDAMYKAEMGKATSASDPMRHTDAIKQARVKLGEGASMSDILKEADRIEREGRK
jgi:hypothetical protein